MPQITVLIATSMKRTSWLISRSLLSVYNQKGLDPELITVVIVDDNRDDKEFIKIKKAVQNLRESLSLSKNHFSTNILRNTATKFNSGTGAWNTGIKHIYCFNKKSYIAILDDDDAYLPNHLSACFLQIKPNTLAVFQSLEWRNQDNSIIKFPLSIEKLQAEQFFIGNPGVQGSNMFFKTEALIAINGFDETLPNTTDRDLMIRFLRKNKTNQIEVIKSVGVIHYNHNHTKVNNNISLKQVGLNLFYQKHKSNFSSEAYQKSLSRAKKYFNFTPNGEK